jgi:mono/diheme cytochrome c family protein
MDLRLSIVHAFRIAAMVAGAAVAATIAAAAHAEGAPLERGRYLVTTIMACGNCHTPKDAQGRPIAGKELSGGGVGIDVPPFAVVAPNITPDRDTGIGSWSDAEIRRAITHGERPARSALAGKPIAVMAVGFFKALLPSDLDAIVVYLRSLPPVRNAVAPPVYRAPVEHQSFPLAERGFVERDLQDKVRRGAYLTTIGHCLECHTPQDAKGQGLYDSALGAGGRPFLPSFVKGLPAQWIGSVSRNLTSDREHGLGGWSDAEIERAITRGIGRDGRKLAEPMAYAWYAGIRAEDLDAIVAFLRTLPPIAR